MFSSIGFGELAIICIVLIIAVGPERLPTMMKTMGKTVRTLRQASRDIRSATGIDEMMRDDVFDMRTPARPYKQPAGPSVSRTSAAVAAPAVAATPDVAATPAPQPASAVADVAPAAPSQPESDTAEPPVVTDAK